MPGGDVDDVEATGAEDGTSKGTSADAAAMGLSGSDGLDALGIAAVATTIDGGREFVSS